MGVEHKICKDCRYNNYPTCSGTIMFNGNEMNIESLKEGFECGQKDELEITDFSIEIKSKLELKMEKLENRIKELENELNRQME